MGKGELKSLLSLIRGVTRGCFRLYLCKLVLAFYQNVLACLSHPQDDKKNYDYGIWMNCNILRQCPVFYFTVQGKYSIVLKTHLVIIQKYCLNRTYTTPTTPPKKTKTKIMKDQGKIHAEPQFFSAAKIWIFLIFFLFVWFGWFFLRRNDLINTYLLHPRPVLPKTVQSGFQ